MNREDAALWTVAVLTYGVGDYLTTRNGLDREGVVESNPIAQQVIDSVGLEVGLTVSKTLVFAVALATYQYAASVEETREYRRLIPLAIVIIGLAIVSHNMVVIEQAD